MTNNTNEFLNTTTRFTLIDEINDNMKHMTIEQLQQLSHTYEMLYLQHDIDENYGLHTHFNIMLNAIDNYIIKRQRNE